MEGGEGRSHVAVYSMHPYPQVDQVICHKAYTNAATHQIIRDNAHLNRHVLEEVTGPR